MRAAVTFSNDNAQEGGNPHIAARNGLICLLTGLVLTWQYKNIFIKLFIIAAIVLSLAVIVLAQVKSALLAMGLMVGFFLFFNANLTNVSKVFKGVFSPRNILIIVLLIVGLNVLLSRYSDLYSMLYGYWDNFQSKIFDIFYTAFGLQLTETATIDASASYRVTSFTYFVNALADPGLLIVGSGYKSTFLDVPILESLINHGIFGFIFFGGFSFYLIVYMLKEIKDPTNPLTLFLAYYFAYFIVALVSGGRPYDVAYWFPFVVMIRFLGIKYFDQSKRVS